LLLIGAAVLIVSFVVYGLRLRLWWIFRTAFSGFSLLIGIYVGLGYIKYSFIQDERRFRRVIMPAIALTAIETLFYTIPNPSKYGSLRNTIEITMGLLPGILFFYAFRLIQNDESRFFRMLSRLNLTLVIIGLCFMVIYYLRSLGRFFPFFPLVLAGAIVAILLWYWQIMLFKHLSLKYKEVGMQQQS